MIPGRTGTRKKNAKQAPMHAIATMVAVLLLIVAFRFGIIYGLSAAVKRSWASPEDEDGIGRLGLGPPFGRILFH